MNLDTGKKEKGNHCEERKEKYFRIVDETEGQKL